jgi:peptidoglycan L-alanyl-D-glutamate endopeptidase CwlK
MNTGIEKMDRRSAERLATVHSALRKVIETAATDALLHGVTFIVTEGVRSTERQAQLVAAGASRTMNSKHLTGRAVDLAVVVGSEVRWDWPLYKRLAQIIKQTAKEAGVPIRWGGDWLRFKDGPHYELADSVQ